MTSLLPRSVQLRQTVRAADVESPAALQIRRFSDFEDARPIRMDWDALARNCGGDFFNTFDWCATWWRHFGHRRVLAIYAAFRSDTLVGIWPLFRETLRWGPVRLHVVRIVGSDHGVTTCNVLTDPEWGAQVAPAMLEAIESDGAWDLLHLGELPGYSANVGGLADSLRQSPHVGAVRVDDDAYPQAVFDVPAHFEEYLSSLSLKERRNLRRDERELASLGAAAREPKSAAELDRAFNNLVRLHSAHWQQRGRNGHFEDVPGVEVFYRDIAEQSRLCGRLALIEVWNQQGVLASEFALRFHNRVHWIIGGRQEEVTSRAGFAALMRAAIRDGVQMIDALPGEYDYKRRLGARSIGVKMIWVLPSSGRGAFRLPLARAIVQAVSLAYHRAWFWHLAPWCHKRMPHLAKLLIAPGLWERFARSRFLVAARCKNSPGTELTAESA